MIGYWIFQVRGSHVKSYFARDIIRETIIVVSTWMVQLSIHFII